MSLGIRSLASVTCFALAFALGGCLNVPELEGTISPDLKTKSYPILQPLDGVLELDGLLPQERNAELTDALSARTERLQDRADALRQSALDDPSRDRLAQNPGDRKPRPAPDSDTE
jgi:hypothetical protein